MPAIIVREDVELILGAIEGGLSDLKIHEELGFNTRTIAKVRHGKLKPLDVPTRYQQIRQLEEENRTNVSGISLPKGICRVCKKPGPIDKCGRCVICVAQAYVFARKFFVRKRI